MSLKFFLGSIFNDNDYEKTLNLITFGREAFPPFLYSSVDKLYKYIPLTSEVHVNRAIDTINNGKFYYSSPTRFNDIYDSKLSFSTMLRRDTNGDLIEFDRIVKWIIGYDVYLGRQYLDSIVNSREFCGEEEFARREKLASNPHELSLIKDYEENKHSISAQFRNELEEYAMDKLSEIMNRIGILSLTEVPDSNLMWAHYASDHTGICVEIERNSSNALSRPNVLPVRYSSKRPQVSLSDCFTDWQSSVHLLDSLITKSNEWSYEKEWRVINSKSNITESFEDLKVKSVIFGAKTSSEHIDLITSNCLNVEFKKIVVSNTEFALNIEKFIN